METEMEKPIIFFSHSSKDSEAVSKIKARINEISNNYFDIFVSSDGQSIPFGKNWVYKIEDALSKSKIMFVFITPNSLLSNWIYFEAGFGYRKDRRVIPVGLGVDISTMKAPLNLLQGFNINSVDSLNNILEILNTDFAFIPSGHFTEEDYIAVSKENEFGLKFNVGKYFDSALFEQDAEQRDVKGKVTKYDNVAIFQKFVDYLESNSIRYTLDNNYNFRADKCILVNGNLIILRFGIPQNAAGTVNVQELNKLIVRVSTINLYESYPVFSQLMSLIDDRQWIGLQFTANPEYSLVTEYEKLSIQLLKFDNYFHQEKTIAGRFNYGNELISFMPLSRSNTHPDSLVISLKPSSVKIADLIHAISILVESEIVYKKR
jgi:hypothetical protein